MKVVHMMDKYIDIALCGSTNNDEFTTWDSEEVTCKYCLFMIKKNTQVKPKKWKRQK